MNVLLMMIRVAILYNTKMCNHYSYVILSMLLYMYVFYDPTSHTHTHTHTHTGGRGEIDRRVWRGCEWR